MSLEREHKLSMPIRNLAHSIRNEPDEPKEVQEDEEPVKTPEKTGEEEKLREKHKELDQTPKTEPHSFESTRKPYEILSERLKYYKNSTLVAKPDTPIVFKYKSPSPRYITFEIDLGGFNNVRMQMEAVIVLAHMTDRILVLPPKQQFYLLHQHSIDDFFDTKDICSAVTCITTQEYLDLHDVAKDSDIRSDTIKYQDYMRERSVSPSWDPHNVLVAVPSLEAVYNTTPTDFFTFDEYRSWRKALELTREEVETETFHVQNGKRSTGKRMFGLFYTFLYFENQKWNWYYLGMVRDHVHYKDIIFDTAAKIILALNELGPYNAIHVRRGEFQYRQTRISAEEIRANIHPLLEKNKTLYISTDEKDREFFKPLTSVWNVRFLSDFPQFLDGIIGPQYGMIEQIVCTAADLFVGTELSSFSAYITRIRAHHKDRFAANKEVYFTTFKITGDETHDNRWKKSSWMDTSKPRFPHSPWSKEYHWFMDLE